MIKFSDAANNEVWINPDCVNAILIPIEGKAKVFFIGGILEVLPADAVELLDEINGTSKTATGKLRRSGV